MENKYLLHNCIIADSQSFFPSGEVLVSGGKIVAAGDEVQISKEERQQIKKYDLGGRLLLPGFTNPHTHLYSSLSAGLSPKGPVNHFEEILSNFWWPLDAAHDEESVYFSAISGIIDAVKHGVTCIFDHHASMNYVSGSLNTVEKAINTAGLKAVLCFETSGRKGPREAEKHLEENLNFITAHSENSRIKGVLGMHANFTLNNSILALASEAVSKMPFEVPIHIHCGEDKADLSYCIESGYKGPVDRLNRYGLLNSGSILAHCIHLSESDFELLHRFTPFVVVNAESNANNRVGKTKRSYLRAYTVGTDGMSYDMISSLRSQYLLGMGLSEDLYSLFDVFFNNILILQNRFFPETGRIAAGFDADIAVTDYVPVTSINKKNLMGHLIFGARGGPSYMTIAEGNILYYKGEITFTFEQNMKEQIKAAAQKLHRRYYG
jgi:cytosine/adenosine deaminase-related metal-dependent hydrolase